MEIETICASCGKTLDSDWNLKGFCEVELCPDCIDAAKDESFNKGYDEGFEQGEFEQGEKEE